MENQSRNTTVTSRAPELKAQAKRLYMEQNYTARAISEQLNVSEKTIGIWIRVNGWKDIKANPYQIKDAKEFIHRFQAHLAKHNASLYLQINNSIIDFLTDYRP